MLHFPELAGCLQMELAEFLHIQGCSESKHADEVDGG